MGVRAGTQRADTGNELKARTQYNHVFRQAEPYVPVAQAILVNKKVCEGKPVEIILHAGETRGTKGIMRPGNIINIADMIEVKEDQRPKWYAQVMARVEWLASTDTQVKEFVDSLQTLKTAKSELAPPPASEVPAAPSAATEAVGKDSPTAREVETAQALPVVESAKN